MNQIQLNHSYRSEPDQIDIVHNGVAIYHGPATLSELDFTPTTGSNHLIVTLVSKHVDNFQYNNVTNQVDFNSTVTVKEIIVESRYFRSLVTKCGLVEVDLEKNLNFPSKYIDHENTLTMEGSRYFIKFDCPIKRWMQIHLHGVNLDHVKSINPQIKEKLLL